LLWQLVTHNIALEIISTAVLNLNTFPKLLHTHWSLPTVLFQRDWLDFFFDFRTHWCAVYPSKKPQSTARDYGKTCEASGEDWCTKSNSNKTHTKYPQNYGTSSNRYMCTDSKSLFFKDNPQNLSNLQSIITILFLLYIFFLWKDKTILYVFINNVPMYNKFSFLLEY